MKKELITSAIACAALIASVTALVVRADNARPDTFFTTASSQTSSQSSQSASKGNARFISQDDFVRAAEQTVNGVVSVKSFATPQSRRQQQYGGDGMYDDPLFEFFFGPPQRRRQQHHRKNPRRNIRRRTFAVRNRQGFFGIGRILKIKQLLQQTDRT